MATPAGVEVDRVEVGRSRCEPGERVRHLTEWTFELRWKSRVMNSSAAKVSVPRTGSSTKSTAVGKGKPTAEKGSTAGGKARADGKSGSVAATAEEIIAASNAALAQQQAQALLDERDTVATRAARIVSEVVTRNAQLLVGAVEPVAKSVNSKNSRVVSAAAEALPKLVKIAPARVAKQLDHLTHAFGEASATGREGLVKTFAGLCSASVAYQKRLEPVLGQALGEADGKTLLRWTEIVLPALKGEPHARARAVVEGRLDTLPRAVGQKVATFLGVKLRPSARG